MTKLKSWLQKQKHAQQRLVTIQQALIGQSLPAYMRYRLRFFSFSTLIITFVHLLEFYLLTVIFSFSHIVSILVLRSISMAAHGAWWGHLELLRSQVRTLQRAGKRDEVASTIASWLWLSLLLAVITLTIIGISVWSHSKPSMSDDEWLFLVYLVVIGIGISAQFLTQTLHAGAYGLRRVYRPFWSIPLANIIGLIVLASLWPWVRQYSLPFSMLVASLAALWLTAHFTLKTYGVLGIEGYCRASKDAFKQLIGFFINREFWLSGISSLLMRTEGVLVMIMLIGVQHDQQHYESFILFYLIAPLISACFDWPRLFYFDLKRFNRLCFKRMLVKLNQYVLTTSLIIGACLWLVTLVIALLYFHRFYQISLLLLPFFLIRAYNGYQLMHRFTGNYYYDVIACAGAVVLMALLSRGLDLSIDGAIASLTVITLLAILYLRNPHSIAIQSIDEDPSPNLYQWLLEWKQLPNQPQPEYLRLADSHIPRPSSKITRIINHALGRTGKACALDDTTIMFYQADKAKRITTQWLCERLSGLVIEHQCLNTPLASFLYNIKSNAAHQSACYVVDRFQQQVPQGIVINFERHSDNPALDKRQATDIYFSMLQSLGEPLELQLRSNYCTLVLYNQGVETLLVVPRFSMSIKQLKYWVQQVYIANLNRLL